MISPRCFESFAFQFLRLIFFGLICARLMTVSVMGESNPRDPQQKAHHQ
jgi:hypothetical protein